jgi:thiol-disulfide isomerase/thioredoxin
MKTIISLAVLSSLLTLSRAADLGDPAAELKIAKWIKGEPVQISGDDKAVYVVEFWATWCPPCRTSIPHLTELQKQFKDRNVIFVGVSDEKENVVAPFVKEWGSKMDYRVAIDDGRKTSEGYMKAYGQGGIPHAFIVQKKSVIWHGHPMAGLDKALEEITSGKYDIAKAKAESKVEALYEEFREAAAKGDDAAADRLANELRVAAKGTSFPLGKFDPEQEKRGIRTQMLTRQFQGAIFSGKDEQAAQVAEKLKALDPQINLEMIRKEVAAQKQANDYLESLTVEGDAEKKSKGSELAPLLKGHAALANEVSWQMLTAKEFKFRDVPLALKIAKQACEDSKWENPQILDTYARALFDSGDKAAAIKYQEKAIAAAGDDKAQYERTLASYKEGKVPSAD